MEVLLLTEYFTAGLIAIAITCLSDPPTFLTSGREGVVGFIGAVLFATTCMGLWFVLVIGPSAATTSSSNGPIGAGAGRWVMVPFFEGVAAILEFDCDCVAWKAVGAADEGVTLVVK